jgi:hypothetical protein
VCGGTVYCSCTSLSQSEQKLAGIESKDILVFDLITQEQRLEDVKLSMDVLKNAKMDSILRIPIKEQ